MVICCPNCQSKFALDAKKANPLSKARCSVCGAVFVLAEGMSDEEFREASARVVADKSSEQSQKAQASLQADVPLSGAPDPGESDADVSEAVSSILKDGGAGFDLDAGRRSHVKTQGRGSKIFAVVAIIIIICAVGLYVGSRVTGENSALNRIASSASSRDAVAESQNGQAAESPAAVERDEESIKDLVIHSVHQYYVKNEKIGQLFVIDGKVLNSFKAPKGLIKVEATLFDGEGKPLMKREQFCGSVATHFQLQVLSKQELEAALNNKVEILTNNTNILPGSEVSFMVVFMNPPDTVREFGVRVVEAKDPD